MAFSMTACAPYIHDYDFTSDTNKIQLAPKREDLDGTTFGSGSWHSRVGGLMDSTLDLSGFWSSTQDAESFPDLGVMDRVVTVSPTGSAGDVAYMLQVGKFEYSAFDAIGALVPYSLTAMGSNTVGMVRGRLAAAKQAVSATGVLGSAQQLGAVGAGQFVYASFHVFGTPGSSITVHVESDDNSGFTSATTVATIGALSAAGGVWMTRVAGALTDTYWRFNVSAITGSFTVAGAIGIQ